MTTDSPSDSTPIDEQTPDCDTVRAEIPDDEVITHVEVPMDTPNHVRQVNAVASHPDTGRSIRHMIVKDDAEGVVKETVIGLAGGTEMWREDRDHVDYVGSDLVRVAPGEVMTIEEYAETIGFDEVTWRLGIGFLDKLESTHDGAPW